MHVLASIVVGRDPRLNIANCIFEKKKMVGKQQKKRSRSKHDPEKVKRAIESVRKKNEH